MALRNRKWSWGEETEVEVQSYRLELFLRWDYEDLAARMIDDCEVSLLI